ncbi:mitochondrial ribosomal death-associated protein 3 domain-containing protein [Sarocladium implicatum]|nr:mitochondrial ribosomal death-associated protein 3 domain-containing protein [Sarocladium implicatum]
MASANALRCIAARPAASPATATRLQPRLLALTTTTTAPFSTTSASLAGMDRRNLPGAMKKNYKSKKGGAAAVPATTKRPGPGERKAFRKRIQLSNNSAFVVQGLEKLGPETLLAEGASGKVVGLPDSLVDQLRSLEAFKATQSWGLFRQPHFLVRDETVTLIKKMDEAVKGKKEALKCVLTGSRLSGKSMAVLQAQSHALVNGWVAIHIPEGQDLTNGNIEYSPIPDTKPVQVAQPTYSQKLLQAILNTNRPVLEKMKLEKDWPNLAHLKAGASMLDLLQSAKETDAAWPTLKAVWTELTLPGRPPVLLTLDGLSHINKISAYRDPAFNPVHAHDLTIVGMFVDALSGKTKLPNGGAIIAANSGNNFLKHPSQELVLSQLEAGQAGKEVPLPDPYEKGYDERVYDALKNCYVQRLEGVTKAEARSLMEYWGNSGMLRHVLDSRTVAEKWALAGHGNIGEMERVALMTMRL